MKKLFIFGNVCKAHVTSPPHQLKYLLTVICFSMWLQTSVAQNPPFKIWSTEIDNPTVGRDWSLAVLEDYQQDIVSCGFTSITGSGGTHTIPSVSKLSKSGTVLWNSWDSGITNKMCSTGNNYGAAAAIIQKKEPHPFWQGQFIFTDYVIITKEKACGGSGTDRTAVYVLDRTTGNVLASNTHVFGSYPSSLNPWVTSAGVDILQKPDLSGYVITGYYKPDNLNQTERIYYAELDNSLNLITTSVEYTIDPLNRNQRPVKMDYVFFYGRIHQTSQCNFGNPTLMGNGAIYCGNHEGYIIVANSTNTNNSESYIKVLRFYNGNLIRNSDINYSDAVAVGYSKVHNESNSCTPQSTNHTAATYITQLNQTSNCTWGIAQIEYGYYAISALFNRHRPSGGCGGLNEYLDGDAAILIWKDIFVVQSPNQCPSMPNYCELESATNVSHLSGADFRFIARQAADGNFICSGSTMDDGIIPSGGGTHFYTFNNDFVFSSMGVYANSNRNWEYAYQGINPTGGCGFGLDVAFNGDIITSGNNGSNHHDLVVNRLGYNCNDANQITEITTNITWNTNRSAYGITKVKNGATLTINNNAVISFANSCAGIEVEPGGTLVVNNATLTKYSGQNYLWKGIKAIGLATINITSATIEHANVAVDCSSYGFMAPVLNISSSTFLNNQKGIRKNGSGMSMFHNDYVMNTQFTTNSNVSSLVESPVRYIELTNANKMTIYSSGGGTTTFTDNTSLDVNAINKSGGAQMQVLNCVFNSIDKGVYLQSSNAADKILNNQFNNIPTAGIWIIGGYNPGNNYAIWNVGSSKWRAEGNTISGVSRGQLAKIYGIITDNSTNDGALVFKNSFTNTYIGLHTQNNNSNMAVSCNDFVNYTYNWSFAPAWYTASGTLKDQGLNNCNLNNVQAGNEWTSLCSGSNVVDIALGGSATNFYYYGHRLNQNNQPTTDPQCSTPAWESTYLQICQSGNGQFKSSPSCNTPFYTCPGCRLADNEWGVDPQLFFAKNHYRSLADDFHLQATTSHDEETKRAAIFYSGYEQLVSNEIIAQLSSKQTIDTLLWYLEASDLPEDKKLLAELYLSIGKLAECRTALFQLRNAPIPVNVNSIIKSEYLQDKNLFIDLLTLVANIYADGRDISESKKNELDAMWMIANLELPVGAKAQVYLKQALGIEFEHEVLPYEHPEDDAKQERWANIVDENNGIHVILYPNPGKDQIVIAADFPSGSGNISVSIFDIHGRKIAETEMPERGQLEINTKEYSNGLYFCKLNSRNNTQRTIRFSILK